jgi:hypothetical protein
VSLDIDELEFKMRAVMQLAGGDNREQYLSFGEVIYRW